jgi:predicted Zn-dependent peptidase
LLIAEIDRLKREGIDAEIFEEEKKAFYGRLIGGLNDVESCGDWILDDCMYGRKPFSLIDSVAALDVQSVEDVLHRCLLTDNKVISIVNGEEQ